nr:PREDICTED: phosphoinositide phospholipase C 6-like isoform X2 [Daucus carota subsp. sativus]
MGSYNYYKMFGYFNRKFEMKDNGPPSDVIQAFSAYTGDASQMSADQLLRFLVEFQGEVGSTLSMAQDLMHQVLQRRNHLNKYTRNDLSLDDFYYFLFQDDLNPPISLQVHHDMTAPLQHYFIYTGHNSYLTGNQLSSDCSEIPIINALERGVRGIELDLWPNSAKDKVHVLHGRTLTTPVRLDKCFQSIRQYAFVKSPYPVIVTLEDHLTPSLREMVAEMAIQIFGELLYYPEPGVFDALPSPDALKHQIVLSTKPPKEYLDSIKPAKETDELGKDPSLNIQISVQVEESDECTENHNQDDEDEADEDEDVNKTQMKPSRYKRLIAIHAEKPKYGLMKTILAENDKVKRVSLSEQELAKGAELYGTDIVRFTQKNLVRVYPKGTRVTSSNFEPLTGWMVGAQMVAFNMQGYGTSLWLMHGMFRGNGGCGYVKKPEILMKKAPHEVFDPRASLPEKKTLKVKLYLGDGWRLDFSHTHFDAYSPPDFYTKIYIVGAPADFAKTRTKIIEDDWSPSWDEEFVFPLKVPELALLRIEVREYDISDRDDFGGQTCLPVSELRPGIRAVPLYDKKGGKYRSVKLLMRFQFE